MRRAVGLLVTALAAMTLGGCGSTGLPQVTVSAADGSVTVSPALWCELGRTGDTTCSVDGGEAAAGHMAVPAGQAAVVHVPAEVAGKPWVVVFAHQSASGEIDERRTKVFDAGERFLVRIDPDGPTDRLTRIEVQAGLVPMATETGGGVDFAALESWIVLAE